MVDEEEVSETELVSDPKIPYTDFCCLVGDVHSPRDLAGTISDKHPIFGEIRRKLEEVAADA